MGAYWKKYGQVQKCTPTVELKGTGSGASSVTTITIDEPCTVYLIFDVYLATSNAIFTVTLNGTAVDVSKAYFNANVSGGWGWSAFKFSDLKVGDVIVATAKNTATGYPLVFKIPNVSILRNSPNISSPDSYWYGSASSSSIVHITTERKPRYIVAVSQASSKSIICTCDVKTGLEYYRYYGNSAEITQNYYFKNISDTGFDFYGISSTSYNYQILIYY